MAAGQALVDVAVRQEDGADAAGSRGMPAEQSVGPLRDPAVGLEVHGEVLRAVDHEDPIGAGAAAIFAEAGAVGVVIAREVQHRVLHLGALDVADTPRGDIHVAAGIDAVPQRRCPQAAAVDVVDAHGRADPFTVVAGGYVAGAAFVPDGVPRRRHVLVPARGEQHLAGGLAHGRHQDAAHHRGRGAGRREPAVQHRAFRNHQFHWSELAVAPGHVPEECVGDGDADQSSRAGKRGVDVAVGLRARAGDVQRQVVGLLGERAEDLERYGLAGLGIQRGEVGASGPAAVRQGSELGPRRRLGVADDPGARGLNELQAELVHQAEIAPGAHVVAGDHGLEVQAHVLRVPALLGEGLEHVLAEDIAFHHLEAHDPDALVEDLGSRPPQHAAGVRGMGAGGHPADEPAVMEDRLDDHHVIGVRSRHVRVVEEELVAVEKSRRLSEAFDEILDGVRCRMGETQVPGAGQHHGAAGVVERAHALPALGDDGGGGDALERHPAFLADGPETVEEHLVADRIDVVRGFG